MSCGCSGNCCNKCGSGYVGNMPVGFSFTHYDVEYENFQDGPGIDHPLVSYYETEWQKSRLAARGGVAVFESAELFLHKLPGMTNAEYNYYRKQARFPQFVRRVKDAIAAKVFQTEADLDDELDYNNLDSEGYSFHALERWALDEIMDVLWGGFLVDIVDGEPKLVRYMAENVRNWKHDKSGRLIRLVLREYCEADPFSFRHEPTERRRVLTLQDDVYVVQVYELIENKDDQKDRERSWRLIPNGEDEGPTDFTVPLTGNGSPLRGIPFFPFGGTMPGDSMLMPLVELAEDLYNLDAWKKNVIREGCFPQKVLICESEDGSAEYAEGTDWFGEPLSEGVETVPLELGTSRVAFLRQAKLEIVESTGASASIVTEEQKRLREEAFDYGASIFQVRNQSNVAAKTEALQKDGDTSLINSMARYLTDALGAALRVAAEWTGREVPNYVRRVDSSMTSFELKDILNLQAAEGAGYIAKEDVQVYLKEAGVIRRSIDEVNEDIEFDGFEQNDLIDAE